LVNLFNRVVLFLYSLIVLAMLVMAAGVLMGVLDFEYMKSAILTPQGIGMLGIMILLSFCIILRTLMGPIGKGQDDHRREFCLLSEKNGEVQVAAAAVKDVVVKSARDVKGVRGVQAQIKVGKEPQKLGIRLRLTVGTHDDVRMISDEVKEAVCTSFHRLFGIEDVSVETEIAAITDVRLKDEPRVR
jgi:uncharacterized alkaline shock family protein YloU